MIRSLRLKFACDENWDAFAGAGEAGQGETAAGERRRCDRCATVVHDLSTLTRAQAAALFRAPPAGGLCVRYQHDGAGRVLFRSERRPGQLVWQPFAPPVPATGEPDVGPGGGPAGA